MKISLEELKANRAELLDVMDRPRTGYSHTLGCYFGSCFDEGADSDQAWAAIQVYRDGNPIELARFATEDEAEDFAAAEMARQMQDHSQFGVGA